MTRIDLTARELHDLHAHVLYAIATDVKPNNAAQVLDKIRSDHGVLL
jgi:hypothetical protein